MLTCLNCEGALKISEDPEMLKCSNCGLYWSKTNPYLYVGDMVK